MRARAGDAALQVNTVECNAELHSLHLFGTLVIGIDENDVLRAWTCDKPQRMVCEMSVGTSTNHVTALVHPSTYLNKIICGREDGSFQVRVSAEPRGDVKSERAVGCVALESQERQIDLLVCWLGSGDCFAGTIACHRRHCTRTGRRSHLRAQSEEGRDDRHVLAGVPVSRARVAVLMRAVLCSEVR
jgi:hypothetical protein